MWGQKARLVTMARATREGGSDRGSPEEEEDEAAERGTREKTR
jgi:hypothetical protein